MTQQEQMPIAKRVDALPPALAADLANAQFVVQSRYYAKGSGAASYEQDVAQVMVKMQWGREMGVNPITAVDSIHVIEGKPSPSGGLVASRIDAHPSYHYEVECRTSEVCRLAFYYGPDLAHRSPFVDGRYEKWLGVCVSEGDDPKVIDPRFGLRPGVAYRGMEEFSIADAQNAKLTGKDNWRKYARAMLFNRAITEGQRAYAPDLWGGASLYTPDELGRDEPPNGISYEIPTEAADPPAKAATLFEGHMALPPTTKVVASTNHGTVEVGPASAKDEARRGKARGKFPTAAALAKITGADSGHKWKFKATAHESDDAKEKGEARRADMLEQLGAMEDKHAAASTNEEQVEVLRVSDEAKEAWAAQDDSQTIEERKEALAKEDRQDQKAAAVPSAAGSSWLF